MRICMMTNTYLPHVGGVARSVHTFSESFRRLGHRVLVTAPSFEGDDHVPARIEKHVVRLPAIQRFNGSDFSVRLPLTWLVEPKLNSFEPDIVHSHHPYLLGDSALRYAAERNVPVVFTHHTLHEQYTHYVPFDSKMLKRFVIELCTQYANLCHAVIAPSESIAQLLAKRGVATAVEVIPTGIDVKAFGGGCRGRFRKAHGLPENAFVVGHLGRLAPEKNLKYLGRGVARFLERCKEAWFLVVGSGPAETALREMFARRGLSGRLVLAGTQSGRRLHDAYAAMDAFAFASLSETQGLVLAEAMAAGLPAVALDAPGVREVVRDGVNGFLLARHAGEDLFARRLRELERDRALRGRMSRGARTTARKFSAEASAQKALRLYRSVIQRTRLDRAQAAREAFGTLLKRIELEWSLINGKTQAAFEAVAERALG